MKPSICLNMIVKDESAVIGTCLASVKKFIDYWVIVDTGSTDGTQEIIRQFLCDIPGYLIERPWVDFAYNRNEAFGFAKSHGDYLLLIDADESLTVPESFRWPELTQDLYYVGIQTVSQMVYHRYFLVKCALDWHWEGVLHETIVGDQIQTRCVLTDLLLVATQGGGRSQDPNKYLKDAAILERALREDPNNSRNVFYLAISYGNARKLEEALNAHERRITMDGDPAEHFYSLLSIAEIREDLKQPPEVFLASYLKAFHFRPSRLEPLSYIARYYISQKCYLIAYLVAKYALSLPRTFEWIFVRYSVYDYELLVQFAECAFQIKRYDECKQTLYQLRNVKTLPAEYQEKIENILRENP